MVKKTILLFLTLALSLSLLTTTAFAYSAYDSRFVDEEDYAFIVDYYDNHSNKADFNYTGYLNTEYENVMRIYHADSLYKAIADADSFNQLIDKFSVYYYTEKNKYNHGIKVCIDNSENKVIVRSSADKEYIPKEEHKTIFDTDTYIDGSGTKYAVFNIYCFSDYTDNLTVCYETGKGIIADIYSKNADDSPEYKGLTFSQLKYIGKVCDEYYRYNDEREAVGWREYDPITYCSINSEELAEHKSDEDMQTVKPETSSPANENNSPDGFFPFIIVISVLIIVVLIVIFIKIKKQKYTKDKTFH